MEAGLSDLTPDAPALPRTLPVEAIRALNTDVVVAHDDGTMRTFHTGATRDTSQDKLDFEGFLSPSALRAFAEYMHTCRKQSNGELRSSDNWQKGIPRDVYMKSMWRHFFAVWEAHRAQQNAVTELCALLFNVQGYLHEVLNGTA